jgi:hypothetical protein
MPFSRGNLDTGSTSTTTDWLPEKLPGWNSSCACRSEVPTPRIWTPGWTVTVSWAAAGCLFVAAAAGGGETQR